MTDRNTIDISAFIEAYTETALWSSLGDMCEPLDTTHTRDDLSQSALMCIEADCLAFCFSNNPDIDSSEMAAAGHDFWLTRNGHGAGFWDGDWDENGRGDRLTTASEAFGECDLYIGDDSRLYVMGSE